jgi:hypothetical protein
VSAELNHTHHPVLLRLVVYFDWQMKLQRKEESERMGQLARLLFDGDSIVAKHANGSGHVWRGGEAGNKELIIAPDDIILAAIEISEVIEREGASVYLSVVEADEGQPLARFR